MKLKTKRTKLLIKKYLFYIIVCSASYLVSWGIVEAVYWMTEKRFLSVIPQNGQFLTGNLDTRELNDGQIEIYNEKTDSIIGVYDQVFVPDYGPSITYYILDELAEPILVCKDQLYGFIDPYSGEVLVEPQFVAAWDLDAQSGLAACVNKELKLGFVNVKTGQEVIPFQFEIDSAYLHPGEYENYLFFDFVFRDGLSLVPGLDGKVGIINESGKIVVPIEYNDIEIKDYGCLSHSYEEIWGLEESGLVHRDYKNNYDFEQPIILMKKDSTGLAQYGVFDRQGIMNVPIEYDQIVFVEYYGKILIMCQKDGIIRGVDQNGNLMSDFCYYNDCAYADNATVLRDPEENLSPYIQYQALNGYAVMDANFRVVVKPNDYLNIQYLGFGLFACERSDNYSVIVKDEKF